MNTLLAVSPLIIATLALAATAPAAEKMPSAPKEYFVFFGTYTGPQSKGIYRSRLDVATGKLSSAELATEAGTPAFLAVHPNQKFLYAVDESADPVKKPGRGVSAYTVDPKSGALTLLNHQSSGGAGPCHLVVDRNGKSVLVANYSAGSSAAIHLLSDGRLGAPGSVVPHSGSSVNAARQKSPHAHGIYLSPDNRFAFVPDLGIDKVQVYRLDAAQAKLSANEPSSAVLPPGSGPRHMVFHPSGKFAYVINELLCTMAVFRYDAPRGALHDVQNVSTLPAGEAVKPGYSTAEVMAHPNGKFIYGSNRGHNSIVVFTVNPGTGALSQVQNQSTLGKTPRNFALDPTGAWLLAENQDSGTVAVFGINAGTGHLTSTGQSVSVPSPVCAVFVAAR